LAKKDYITVTEKKVTALNMPTFEHIKDYEQNSGDNV